MHSSMSASVALIVLLLVSPLACAQSGAAPGPTAVDQTTAVPTEPYDLKGDRVGMSRAEFQAKYSRQINQKLRGPLCSDEGWAGRTSENPHVVHCVTWSSEERSAYSVVDNGRPKPPSYMTIADLIPSEYDFGFYDGRLFAIEVEFHIDFPGALALTYGKVYDAAKAKYGKPTAERFSVRRVALNETYEIGEPIWDNGISRVQLSWVGQKVTLTVTHTELLRLLEETSKRAPDL